MASRRKTAGTSAKRAAATRPSHVTSRIRFTATLLRPAGKRGTWTFLKLPDAASARLPSRGQTTVEGTFNGVAIQVTLDPDGEGGHWMKVDRTLRDAAGAQVGDAVLRVKVSTVTSKKDGPDSVFRIGLVTVEKLAVSNALLLGETK